MSSSVNLLVKHLIKSHAHLNNKKIQRQETGENVTVELSLSYERDAKRSNPGNIEHVV